MDLIILTDGLYHLVPVTKAMVADIKVFTKDILNKIDEAAKREFLYGAE